MDVTEEQLEVIISIAEKLSHKYKFGYYGSDDIKQEAIILGMKAVKDYDGKRSFAAFMYTHIRNRLNTLKRDRYYRLETGKSAKLQEAKKSLIDTVDIDNCAPPVVEGEPHINEVSQIILEGLPSYYRSDYLRMLEGVKISSGRKANIIGAIKELLGDYYEVKNGPVL